MAATSAIRGFGAQNVMQQLMRKESTPDSLVAMLASCSNNMGLQVPCSLGGGLEDAVIGCGQKRLFYPSFDSSLGEYEAAWDEEYGGDECSPNVEKKRRLTLDQVRSLERNFEVENKLEPERKMQLATELGLQPRQVAVWFQNRRARWKTKQLERDYEVLTLDYGRLKAEFEAIVHEKESLKSEVQRLSGIKSKVVQEQISGSGSETKTYITSDHVHVNSIPTKSERQALVAEQFAENRDLQWRPSAKRANAMMRPTSTEKVEQLETGLEQSTSADSNSSEILNTDSPGTTTTIHSQMLALPSQLVNMLTEQTATCNASCPAAQNFTPADHHGAVSFVHGLDPSLQLQVDDDVCAGATNYVSLLSPQDVYDGQHSVLIKLEDKATNKSNKNNNTSSCNIYNQADDHSCCNNYFLSQLDDKGVGSMPWWDWS